MEEYYIYKKDKKVNLNHIIKSESLLTKKQIKEIEKSEESSVHQKCNLEYRDFLPDDTQLSIWGRFRKPEFQRPTFCWNISKIVKLLNTMLQGRVIPGVILWLDTITKHIFILDGAHRLSVIRAWILDDWGDIEHKENRGKIDEKTKRDAQRVREIVNKEVGSYEDNIKLAKRFSSIVEQGDSPEDFMTEEELIRGKQMYSLSTSLTINIQWVIGGYDIAEKSFLDINTGGQGMTPQEVQFLKNRRSPVARVISGISSNGMNSKVWIGEEERCSELSKSLYSILFSESKPEDTDLPFTYFDDKSGFEKFEILLDIITICRYGKTGQNLLDETLTFMRDEEDDEKVKNETVRILEDLHSKFSNIVGNTSKSVGLLPNLYFYASSGKYRTMLLLMFLSWFSYRSEKELKERKLKFTQNREIFESVWLKIRDYFYQGVNRSGVGPRRITNETIKKLDYLLNYIVKNKKMGVAKISEGFMEEVFPIVFNKYMNEVEHYNTNTINFNRSTKIKIGLLTIIRNTCKCPICGGFMDIDRSIQYDHILEKSRGGLGDINNGRIVHPWCNNNREVLKRIGNLELGK